jgi:DNA-binding NarL/FixJ family response regulator/AraC-like DNA-binding protein
MIVDDEILAIHHLREMIRWEEFGFTVAASTESAKRALELAESVNPDLVFMDIRMPVMDGLEVSRRLLSNNGKMKVVLLTSHKDFEYAKEALNIGVSNYLLKHEMNADQLVKQLARVKEELEAEKQGEQAVIRQQLRELLVLGKSPGEGLQRREKKIQQSKGYMLMMFLFPDRPFPIIETVESAPQEPIAEWDASGIGEQGQELELIERVYFGGGKWGMLLAAYRPHSEYRIRTLASNSASAVRESFRQQGGASGTVFISPIFKRLPEAPNIYRTLEKIAPYAMLSGREQVIWQQDIGHADAGVQADVKPALEAVRSGVEHLNEDALMKELDAAFRLACPNPIIPGPFRQLCHGLILILEQSRERIGLPSYTELLQRGELDTSVWHQAEGIRQWFKHEFAQLIAHLGTGMNYSKKVQLAIQHIHRHYKEDLTLDVLGEALSVSGERLRHLFKEETGRTVSDYLTWYRLEKAKELLASGNYKVYEISEMVGYKSSQYFSLVFRKSTGLTPQEFWRGRHKTDENADQIENHRQ